MLYILNHKKVRPYAVPVILITKYYYKKTSIKKNTSSFFITILGHSYYRPTYSHYRDCLGSHYLLLTFTSKQLKVYALYLGILLLSLLYLMIQDNSWAGHMEGFQEIIKTFISHKIYNIENLNETLKMTNKAIPDLQSRIAFLENQALDQIPICAFLGNLVGVFLIFGFGFILPYLTYIL